MIHLTRQNIKAFQQEIVRGAYKVRLLLLRELTILLEELINEAQENGNYKNRTGNLRSSIGGVVLDNGKPFQQVGFAPVAGTESGESGVTDGKKFLESIIRTHKNGIVVIVVAGRKYGVYVQKYYGYNVLLSAETLCSVKIPQIELRIQKVLNKVRT